MFGKIPPRVRPGDKRLPADTVNAGRRALLEMRRRPITRVPALALGGIGAEADPTDVHRGQVVSATAARSGSSGCGFVPGEVVAKEWITPPVWAGGGHDSGDVVTLPTAGDFDAGAAYAEGDLAVEDDLLYQADDDITAAAFDEEEWTLIGTPGDNYCANATVEAGAWNGIKWDATDSEFTTAATTTTLIYTKPTAPAEGSTVVWINGVVVEDDTAGSEAGCGAVEISNLGGFAVRFVSSACTSPWSVIPSLLCNDVAVTPPESEPT